MGNVIKDNLVLSIGEGRDNTIVALQLSDIFAWDIDFTTDLRNGDVFKIVVEGLYLPSPLFASEGYVPPFGKGGLGGIL